MPPTDREFDHLKILYLKGLEDVLPTLRINTSLTVTGLDPATFAEFGKLTYNIPTVGLHTYNTWGSPLSPDNITILCKFIRDCRGIQHLVIDYSAGLHRKAQEAPIVEAVTANTELLSVSILPTFASQSELDAALKGRRGEVAEHASAEAPGAESTGPAVDSAAAAAADAADAADAAGVGSVAVTIPYSQLRTDAPTAPDQTIDTARREEYLSPEEFEELFHLDLSGFRALPKTEQTQLKRELKLL
eukprot:NODE_1357_length_893_cov_101.503916_g1311_i0.p1 GENE.NODE_1357_length_893_cov_101.503916_g1311_i0~~NODE_1357_length_893_cov_101.503916_g1311_i0.p1  ORF type:complete len:282 (-),score=60.49 NODE_1357_length_893_cov_101.503916_g1311_i0:47-784(-)